MPCAFYVMDLTTLEPTVPQQLWSLVCIFLFATDKAYIFLLKEMDRISAIICISAYLLLLLRLEGTDGAVLQTWRSTITAISPFARSAQKYAVLQELPKNQQISEPEGLKYKVLKFESSLRLRIRDAVGKFRLPSIYLWKPPYSRRSLEERLTPIPVFAVTNLGGSPYMTPTPDGLGQPESTALLFTHPADVEAYRDLVAESGSEAAADKPIPDTKVFTMTLDKAWKLVSSTLHQQGSQNGSGVMRWKFQPNQSQVDNATKPLHTTGNTKAREDWRYRAKIRRRCGLTAPLSKISLVPLFHCGELKIRKNNELISPLYFDLEDLMQDWNAARLETNGTLPHVPNVIDVYDLAETLIFLTLKEKSNREEGVAEGANHNIRSGNLTTSNNNSIFLRIFAISGNFLNSALYHYYKLNKPIEADARLAGLGKWGFVASRKSMDYTASVGRSPGVCKSRILAK